MRVEGLGRRAITAAALLVSTALLGCPAFNSGTREVDRTPIVHTGVGASIIMPGQTAPVVRTPQTGPGGTIVPGGQAQGAPQAAPGQAPAQAPHGGGGTTRVTPEGGSYRGGAPASGGPPITMIGGTRVDEKSHVTVEEAPIWWKYVRLPFVAVAAPFVYLADKLGDDEEAAPGPAIPERAHAAATTPPPVAPPQREDYETATLRQLENELAQRQQSGATAPPPAPVRATAPAPRTTPSSGSALAAELAALRRGSQPQASQATPAPRVAATSPRTQPAPAPRTATAAPPGSGTAQGSGTGAALLATASGHVDRDGDGATDQWIFRENGEIVREHLDEDFDGRPDRTLHYDTASHQIRAIEEDANHDGRPDTWTSVRDGAIVRRRADDDADGHVDTWSYYKNGVLTRLERDATGDGFRDRISHYQGGRLAREEQDDDADGLADLVKHYDAEERIERLEEDSNGDGRIDVISHFEQGRLKRRELLEAELLTPAPSMNSTN